MKDIMVDLETLGQCPGCSIISIGAVAFDRGGLGPEFYTPVNLISCREAGLHESLDTLAWWSAEARAAVVEAETTEVSLLGALVQLGIFLASVGPPGGLRVWGNGSDFDNAILACAYSAVDKPLPWRFWNNRCYRTAKAQAPNCKIGRGAGAHHAALGDAKNQALHLIQIMKLGVIELR